MTKVVFIGGLTNGRIVYEYLKANKNVSLCLSITYPDFSSMPRHIFFENNSTTIKTTSIKDSIHKIQELKPDIIFVAGWSELIPPELLDIPPMGVIGFHPSKLPYDRGRSVLAWQIAEGYTDTALTMFKYTTYPDGGDILAQEHIRIENTDYINDVLDKIDSATLNIMKAYFPLLRKGLLVAKKQDLSEGNFRRLRGENDSLIDWTNTVEMIYNQIRAISHPYPGAQTEIDNKVIYVWRSEILKNFPLGHETLPGTIVAKCYDNTLIIKARDGFIRITEWNYK